MYSRQNKLYLLVINNLTCIDPFGTNPRIHLYKLSYIKKISKLKLFVYVKYKYLDPHYKSNKYILYGNKQKREREKKKI